MSRRHAIRNARLASFASRALLNADGVLTHRAGNWRYIPVHPFADDYEVLARMGWPSANCWSVDAYWECEADVYLVQAQAIESAGGSSPGVGLYYRREDTEGYVVNFVAVIEARVITRESFEGVLGDLRCTLPSVGKARRLTRLR
jgi:hypothetical protein